MHHLEFEDEAERINGFVADAVPPISEELHDQRQITVSPPPVNKGYDPYTLALRIVSILFLLCLLFVAALYYGVINP